MTAETTNQSGHRHQSLACKNWAKAAWHVMAQDVPYDAVRVFGPGKKKDFGETGREPANGSGQPEPTGLNGHGWSPQPKAAAAGVAHRKSLW